MLLDYIVSQREIKANPTKIKAKQGLKKAEDLADVQKLTGCIAALSRFISRLGEKTIPLYRLLKKSDKFVWDKEADDAFELLKKTLAEAPVLVAPAPKEPLLLCHSRTACSQCGGGSREKGRRKGIHSTEGSLLC